jgi:hypothetical protein
MQQQILNVRLEFVSNVQQEFDSNAYSIGIFWSKFQKQIRIVHTFLIEVRITMADKFGI